MNTIPLSRRACTRSRVARWAVAVAALAAVVPASAVSATQILKPAHNPTHEHGAVIVAWNETAMSVLTPSGRPLQTQTFVVAAMHVAMYDAVVAIEGGAKPFAVRLAALDDASSTAAAATAAHRVLVGFLPDHAATFDAALQATLADVPDGDGERDGVAVGEAAGWATLAVRLGDGSQSGPIPALPAPGPGVWQPTPPAKSGLNPWVAAARPYTLRSNDQFRPDPPDIDSNRYRRDLDEVRRLGSATSTERTAQQTEVARFWADQPIAQNQRTLRRHAIKLDGDIVHAARFFAAVLTSEADAFIACWDAKYHHLRWRPWQAVPTVEPGWIPLLGTPNHPEFPAAHGCLTGALAFALARLTGSDHIDLDIDATSTGTTRHYDTVDQLVTEVGNARIWGGIHLRSSVDAGTRIAERVVRHNLNHNFKLEDLPD
jgi:hypothetical protein